MSKKIRLLFIFFYFIFIVLEGKTIKVGIYQNLPKIGLDRSGRPAGIFVDILNDIAKSEGWKIEWVFNEWDSCLILLKNGDIHLMPDVALSEERRKEFDFNKIPVLSSWVQVLTRRDISLSTIEDLNGLKVAVLKGSIQEEILEEIQYEFRIKFDIIPLPDYITTIRYVK